jgi:hypothetical protein
VTNEIVRYHLVPDGFGGITAYPDSQNGPWVKWAVVGPELTQLRVNLSLAEDGLASATQEIEELRAAGKILVDEGDRHLAEYNAEIEQHKRNLAWQSKEIDAQVTEIQLLRDQRDSNLAKEVETVQRLNAEVERLRQARLTWAMACHCACPACDTFFNVFRANANEPSEQLRVCPKCNRNWISGKEACDCEPSERPVAWRTRTGLGDWYFTTAKPHPAHVAEWEPLYIAAAMPWNPTTSSDVPIHDQTPQKSSDWRLTSSEIARGLTIADLVSNFHPAGRRERYTVSGWVKWQTHEKRTGQQ